jgi:hypothetical protein
MTTLTVEAPINLPKTHFKTLEELYYSLQNQLKFENDLQKKAEEAMFIDENKLLNL